MSDSFYSTTEIITKFHVKRKPLNYISLVDGSKYPYGSGNYNNHGFDGEYEFKEKPHEARGIYKDLPKDKYPYTIEYLYIYPAWFKNIETYRDLEYKFNNG